MTCRAQPRAAAQRGRPLWRRSCRGGCPAGQQGQPSSEHLQRRVQVVSLLQPRCCNSCNLQHGRVACADEKHSGGWGKHCAHSSEQGASYVRPPAGISALLLQDTLSAGTLLFTAAAGLSGQPAVMLVKSVLMLQLETVLTEASCAMPCTALIRSVDGGMLLDGSWRSASGRERHAAASGGVGHRGLRKHRSIFEFPSQRPPPKRTSLACNCRRST
jgi:hypothetical protein